MPKTPLVACLDANVIISAIAFGGLPLAVLDLALCRAFLLVLGPNIIATARRALVGKLGLPRVAVDRVLTDLMEVASVFVPTGQLQPSVDMEDNLVLEVAVLGASDVLVTGDKRHLLPLGSFQGMVIEPPSKFLMRFR